MLGSLEEWERRLRPQIAKVDLLGDLQLSREDLHCIGRLIRILVHDMDWSEALDYLERHCPCTYAAFLVALGIHYYEAGDFWSAVRKVTGLHISTTQASQLGQLFENIVKRLPVVQFPHISGHRYVGPILAHGGIPNYCLPDFFEKFLQPLLRHPEYASLSAEEFIKKQLAQASVAYTTDKPVLRFLQYGGPLAVDFLERCWEMALHYTQKKERPSPEELGLSPRVVEAYQKWLKEQMHFPVTSRTAYRSPELFLDPWGAGLCLRLPSQPISTLSPDLHIVWQISPHDDPEVYGEIQRVGTEWRTVPQTIALTRPAEEYRVIFALKQKDVRNAPLWKIREWQIPGIPTEPPVLWFDRNTGRLLRQQDVLPKNSLWVLRHQNVTVEGARVAERFPDLPWEWHEYVTEEIDPSSTQNLQVRWGNTCWNYPVVDVTQMQPYLVGNEPFPAADEQPPVYTGRPPSLHIPLPFRDKDLLQRFHIELRNEGSASPEVQVSEVLSRLDHQLQNGEAIIDLSTWLGENPTGIYRVRVLGPLGYRAILMFCVLPFFEVAGHEIFYAPDDLQEAHLLVETSAEITLSTQSEVSPCTVVPLEERDGHRLYEVTARATCSDFLLQLLYQRVRKDPVCIPLRIPIRRLRWMVALGPEVSNPEWRVLPERLPLSALEESLDPLLFVDVFGGIRAQVTVHLSLHDEAGTVLQEAEIRCRPGQRYIRFCLAAFLDTLRQISSFATFRITVKNLPGLKVLSCPVLEISRRFVVERVQVSVHQEDEVWYFTAQWKSSTPARNRRILLWPLWRPWEPPVEIPIPDTAKDSYQWTLPVAQLVSGKYLLEVTGFNSQVLPDWPGQDASQGVLLYIPPDAPEKRLEELLSEYVRKGATFLNTLESALLRYDIGQRDPAIRALKWCIEHLNDADTEYIISIMRALLWERNSDRSIQEILVHPQLVVLITKAFSRGCVSEAEYREYLCRLPPPSVWPDATCRLFLTSDDSNVRYRALQQLIERRYPESLSFLSQWLQTGQIPFDTAVTIVENSLPWILREWRHELSTPPLRGFLETLWSRHPDQVPPVVIRPGYWVRCAAGWGRVERITTQDGNPCTEFFFWSEERNGLLLHVLLRAQETGCAERVVLSMEDRTVFFPGAERVYVCGKCKRFASQSNRLVTEEHDRRVHDGIRPSFLLFNTPVLHQEEDFEFQPGPPSQPWE